MVDILDSWVGYSSQVADLWDSYVGCYCGVVADL